MKVNDFGKTNFKRFAVSFPDLNDCPHCHSRTIWGGLETVTFTKLSDNQLPVPLKLVSQVYESCGRIRFFPESVTLSPSI